MIHEREHDRSHGSADAHRSDLEPTPARTTRSSQLDAPAHPIASGLIQRKAADDDAALDGSRARDLVAAAASSSGAPLQSELRGRLESSLRADLSSVRVHTGAESAAAASAVGAVAYTTGQNIHFGAGKYDPDSPAGQSLIAHEVAHTVQQRGVSADVRQDKLEVSSPGDAHEIEAEAFAQSFVAGDTATVTPVTASSVSRMVISRAPPNAAPAPGGSGQQGAFTPVIANQPGATSLQIGQDTVSNLNVGNAKEAPSGTTYLWTSPGETRASPVAVVGIDNATSAHAKMKLRGRSPGSSTVPAHLDVKAGDGSALGTSDDPAGSFTVVAPGGNWELTGDPNASGVINWDGFTKGQKIRAKLNLQNVTDAQVASPLSVTVQGAGVFTQGEQKVDKTSIQVELVAATVGSAHMKVGVGIGDWEGPASPNISASVEMDKQEFINACSGTHIHLDLVFTKAESALIKTGQAYTQAWQTHTSYLKAEQQVRDMAQQLTVGAALAFLPGGAGGVVGGILKKAGGGDFIVDGVKDLAKFGLRQAGGAAAGPAHGGGASGLSAFPTDPVLWKENAKQRMLEEKAKALEFIDGWVNKARKDDPSFSRNFDPAQAVESSLKTDLGEVPDGGAAGFEKAMWVVWLGRYAYLLETHKEVDPNPFDHPGGTNPGTRSQASVVDNVSKKIAEHCKSLGLDVEQYGNKAQRQREADTYNDQNKDYR